MNLNDYLCVGEKLTPYERQQHVADSILNGTGLCLDVGCATVDIIKNTVRMASDMILKQRMKAAIEPAPEMPANETPPGGGVVVGGAPGAGGTL